MDEDQNTMKGLEKREATKMDKVKDKMFLLMFKLGEVKSKEKGLYLTDRGGREVWAQEDWF